MAWTAPRNWTLGQVVTGAELDVDLRANLRYLKGTDGRMEYDDIVRYSGDIYGKFPHYWAYDPDASPEDLILGFVRDGADDYTVNQLFGGTEQEIKHTNNVGSVTDHEHNPASDGYDGTIDFSLTFGSGSWADSNSLTFANYSPKGLHLIVAKVTVRHDQNDTGLQLRLADKGDSAAGPISYIDNYVPSGGYAYKSAMCYWVVDLDGTAITAVKLQGMKDVTSPTGNSIVYGGPLAGAYKSTQIYTFNLENVAS